MIGFFKPAQNNWLLSKSRPITYNAESSNWPALGFLQLVICSKLQHLWISPTYGFLKDIFAGLHCNHGQGFLLSQRHHQLTEWIWFYSTMEGIVPSRCRHTTRHLGATLFKSRLHQSMKVPCRCKHAPWHLGANANCSFKSSHHQQTRLFQGHKSALGGYRSLLIQVWIQGRTVSSFL